MNKNTKTSFEKLIKEVVEQHNIIRADPKSYIPHLEKQIKYFTGKVMNKPGAECGLETQEGKAAYTECIEFLKKQKPLGALIHDAHLSKASQDHADDIGPNGASEHTGTDGSTVDDRIKRYLEWDVTISENIDFGGVTGEEVIISLIVDDGIAERGHRKNVFEPAVKFIGVGCADHTEYQICTVLNYVGAIASYNDKSGSTKAPSKDALKNAVINTDSKKKAEEKSLAKDFANKAKVSGNDNEELENDPDAPEGTVSCSISIETTKTGKKTITKTTKVYTLADGSTSTLEIEESS